ncbi:hypothetical protein [Nocardioides convexus]|uniref:hypothetical protein n=1 Tax=Nocardioides convexus TaxID=2712224 RepID=UPI0024184EA0|nr:hypothetical protein [Nocardioides convexus]
MTTAGACSDAPDRSVRRLLALVLTAVLTTVLVAGCSSGASAPGRGGQAAERGYVPGPYRVAPGVVLGTPVDDPETQAAQHPVVARLLEPGRAHPGRGSGSGSSPAPSPCTRSPTRWSTRTGAGCTSRSSPTGGCRRTSGPCRS